MTYRFILPIIVVLFVAACGKPPEDPLTFTKIVCEVHGEMHEHVQRDGTWWRDIGFGTVVVMNGLKSYPADACTWEHLGFVDFDTEGENLWMR